MSLVFKIYKKAFKVMAKKPIKLWAISLLSILFGLLGFLLGGTVFGIGICIALLLEVSMANIFLNGYHGEEPHILDLFSTFKDVKTAKRTLAATGWQYLWIFLWSIIPGAGIVFGLIKGYEYSMVPYIILKDPDVGPTDAVWHSSKMTKGYKHTMFLADLFIALIILVVCGSLSLIGTLLCLIPVVGGFFGGVFFFALYVVSIFVEIFLPLFKGLVKAAFYEEITGVESSEEAAPATEE